MEAEDYLTQQLFLYIDDDFHTCMLRDCLLDIEDPDNAQLGLLFQSDCASTTPAPQTTTPSTTFSPATTHAPVPTALASTLASATTVAPPAGTAAPVAYKKICLKVLDLLWNFHCWSATR